VSLRHDHLAHWGFSTANVVTGVGLVLCVTGNGATYTLTVDGRIVRTTGARNDPACADYGSTATLVASELDLGRHTAELNVITTSEEQEFRFYGGEIWTQIDVGRCVRPPCFTGSFHAHVFSNSSSQAVSDRMIDDSAPEWVMVPGRGRQQVSFILHCDVGVRH